jgi:AcrR family transcriptional regulator
MRTVPKRRATAPRAAAEDRRVRRTRQALTRALMELVGEKRYGAITIQDLLDRADVGRSTFYAHYRGKDDLLLRSFERMLDMLDRSLDAAGGGGARVAPVRELFHHVSASRGFHRAMTGARMVDRIYQVGTAHMERTIARRLAARAGRWDDGVLAVAARGYAGSLFAILSWWLERNAPHTPERMDEIYHALVLPAGTSDARSRS